MSKVTVTAPANIAFIKYWGTRDADRVLPFNPSISMTLGRCLTRTTVELRPDDERIDVALVDEHGRVSAAPTAFAEPVRRHLERIRQRAGRSAGFRVATRNSFPTGAGIASSASGFAALTLAAARVCGLDLDATALSALARLSGSGSAARSVFGGFVQWPAQARQEQGHAVALAPEAHWDLRNLVVVVDRGPKTVSSREGHRRAPSSPHYEKRLRLLPERLETTRQAIRDRDLRRLGSVVEEEAIELHLIAMSSRPPILYWKPATLAVIERVRRMRTEGLETFFTIDAGPNVHVICDPASALQARRELERLAGVQRVIADGIGGGPRYETGHLF